MSGTGLVRVKNGDGGQLLNSGNTGDNGLVLGELLSTDGESNGKDSGHSNGDTTNEEDEDVVETTTVCVMEYRVENDNLENDEDTNGDETERTDLRENLLQVTCRVIVLTNERSGATEECIGTGGDDNTLSFTLFASGTTERKERKLNY